MIVKVRPLFFVLVFLTLAAPARADDSRLYIEKARQLRLADHPLWRALLHYKGRKSQIHEESFFLSGHGATDPQSELDATLTAYFTGEHSIEREGGDRNIACIFPARYMWLNEQLGLPGYAGRMDACPGLQAWARLQETEAVSLIFVSGYLGNPASSFGHVLLNLKIAGSDDMLRLYDTSVSYGATVPLNENIVLYVVKGLFGGYWATFSDKFFYAHDQVYTNREFRDMWEYVLNLSDRQKKFLIYHIAELLTKRFRYYFLSSNCAQRIAVLLDIFIAEDVYNFEFPVYVPEELFQRLQDIDADRRGRGEPGLIESITYIPSARRHLFYELARLSDEERQAYARVVKGGAEDFAPYLKDFSEEDRIDVLNALLAYQYYRLMQSEEDSAPEELKRFKDKVLLERLRLPSQKYEPLAIPEIPSPREMAPPSAFNAGVVIERGQDPFTQLGVTVFRKESVGLNALEYSELVSLDWQFGLFAGSDKIFLDRFDFLRIRDFRTFYIPEAGETPYSWRVRAGVDRYFEGDGADYDGVFDGGAGLVRKLGRYGICYGFLNGGLHTRGEHFRVEPTAGCVVGTDGIKLQVDYGFEFGLDHSQTEDVFGAKLQVPLDRKNALQVGFEKNERERVTVSYIRYW